MKKLFSVLAVLFVLGTANVFSLGVGAQGGYPLGGALTLKLDELPCIFAVDARFGNPTGFGVTADWWMANPKINDFLGYYYGIGVGGDIYLGNNLGYLAAGPRVFAGANATFLDDFLEVYLQLSYQPSFDIYFSGGNSGLDFHWFGIGLTGGFRVWF